MCNTYSETITSLYAFYFLSYQRILFILITAHISAFNNCCVLGTILKARDVTVKKKMFCFGKV